MVTGARHRASYSAHYCPACGQPPAIRPRGALCAIGKPLPHPSYPPPPHRPPPRRPGGNTAAAPRPRQRGGRLKRYSHHPRDGRTAHPPPAARHSQIRAGGLPATARPTLDRRPQQPHGHICPQPPAPCVEAGRGRRNAQRPTGRHRPASCPRPRRARPLHRAGRRGVRHLLPGRLRPAGPKPLARPAGRNPPAPAARPAAQHRRPPAAL